MLKEIQDKVSLFFGISRQEANGFLVLLPLFLLLLFSPFLMNALMMKDTLDQGELAVLDSAAQRFELGPNVTKAKAKLRKQDWPAKKTDSQRNVVDVPAVKFRFDPNKISVDSALLLGFDPVVARRMVKYRMNGGSFKYRKDLKKIYGLSPTFYASLASLIDLPEKPEQLSTSPAAEPSSTVLTVKEEKVLEPFDINQADTSVFSRIQGIGPVLSRRIVKFRAALGGFVEMSQIEEVYGLKPEVVAAVRQWAYITPTFLPPKLQLNSSTEQDLAAHPYLSRSEAKSIARYRWQHGDFEQVADLLKIHTLRETTYKKIFPYLEL